MFHAFVIVCAATASFEVTDLCFRVDDEWGPYKTEENCSIRTTQIGKEITTGGLKEAAFIALNYPEQIYAEGYCEKVDTDPVV